MTASRQSATGITGYIRYWQLIGRFNLDNKFSELVVGCLAFEDDGNIK